MSDIMFLVTIMASGAKVGEVGNYVLIINIPERKNKMARCLDPETRGSENKLHRMALMCAVLAPKLEYAVVCFCWIWSRAIHPAQILHVMDQKFRD